MSRRLSATRARRPATRLRTSGGRTRRCGPGTVFGHLRPMTRRADECPGDPTGPSSSNGSAPAGSWRVPGVALQRPHRRHRRLGASRGDDESNERDDDGDDPAALKGELRRGHEDHRHGRRQRHGEAQRSADACDRGQAGEQRDREDLEERRRVSRSGSSRSIVLIAFACTSGPGMPRPPSSGVR